MDDAEQSGLLGRAEYSTVASAGIARINHTALDFSSSKHEYNQPRACLSPISCTFHLIVDKRDPISVRQSPPFRCYHRNHRTRSLST